MLKINSYTTSGTKTSLNLPRVFQEKVNLNLLAQAIRVYQDREHPGLSKVKTRGELGRSTAKIWRQKGTGRARHGSRSAPIFVGGGIAHGPKGIKKTLKLSKKSARKALNSALILKAKKSEMICISKLSSIKKTKEAQNLISMLINKENLAKSARITLILAKEEVGVKRVFKNLKNVEVLYYDDLNAFKVFQGGVLLIEKDSLELLVKKMTDGKKEILKKTEISKNLKSTQTKNVVIAKKKVKRTTDVNQKKGTK